MQCAGFKVTTTNPDEFFATPLDIVDVCSPNDLHFNQVSRALEQGLNVYCENHWPAPCPKRGSWQTWRRKTGTKTHVAFTLRYVPAVRQMKAMLLAGAIGEVYHF